MQDTVQKHKANWLMRYKIGPLPVPVYVILAAIIFGAAIYGKLPADMIGGIAVMMIMGMLLDDIGLKVPVLKDIGGPACGMLILYLWMCPEYGRSYTSPYHHDSFSSDY